MGYKTEQFVGKVDENLICAICCEVFQDPMSCKDGHTFCKDCITKWIKQKKKCPLDNSVLEENQLVRVLTVRGIINNLDVYCHSLNTEKHESTASNEVEDQEPRCEWNGKLQSLMQHRKMCPFQEVQCPHGCDKIIIRRKIEDHEKTCEYRTVECNECGISMVQHKIEKHKMNDCLQALILCPNKCTNEEELLIVKIKRADLDDHLANVCSKAIVDCPYKAQGCSVGIEHKDIEKHVRESMAAHMMLLGKECSLLRERNKSLANQCSSLFKDALLLEDELNQVQDHRSVMDNKLASACTYTWTINGILAQTTRRNLYYFRSPKFWLCGYYWYMLIYPEGDHDNETRGFLSLYLHAFCDSDSDYGGPIVIANGEISVHFRLTVVSQSPDSFDVSYDTNHMFRYKKSENYGWDKFMESEEMFSEEYYDSRNDSITIKCTILNQ